ncbi:hypothetical protein RvY_16315 [Ramazzottius varieornatus]|uniref:Metalloendopeptidase n=1 Tax=Ramazzottius varieornatus TaxID=947166 RepID=A0A1D1VYY8_RAMVA|nr:hypothetical protein RvY_16315 [Ramazzottius varieornatus]
MGVSLTTFLLLASALLGVAYGARSKLRTTNTDVKFGRWNRTGIPYCIDSSFTSTQAQMIQAAIAVIMADLNYCVAWTPVGCSSPVYKVRFTSLTAGPGSAPQTYCWSYPGVYLDLRATTSEQIISLATGPTGCFDGTLHSLMKPMAIAMGKRNEHQRGDRDNFITVQSGNVAVQSAYTMYPTDGSQAFWGRFPYDYCSITHNQPGDFALPNTAAFTMPAGASPSFIPKLDRLSLTDCKLLNMLYGCDSSACNQPICTVQATQAGSATTMATTTMSNLPCCPQGTSTGMTAMVTMSTPTGSTPTGSTSTAATSTTGSTATTGTTPTGMTTMPGGMTTMAAGMTPACVPCVCTPVGVTPAG